MLDEQDLQAIAQMLSAQENRLRERIDAQDKKFSERMDAQKKEIIGEVNVLLENVVTPKFNLLAEAVQDIREKMVPRSRLEELEDEMKFLKSIVRQMNEYLQELKKAN